IGRLLCNTFSAGGLGITYLGSAASGSFLTCTRRPQAVLCGPFRTRFERINHTAKARNRHPKRLLEAPASKPRSPDRTLWTADKLFGPPAPLTLHHPRGW